MGWDVHEGDGLAHYARACTDITFRFPFGVQELMGIAARGNFDLTQHSEGSGKGKEKQEMNSNIYHCAHLFTVPLLVMDDDYIIWLCLFYVQTILLIN